MTSGVQQSIREHLPRPSLRLLVGGAVVAIVAICLLDGAIAAWATHTTRSLLEEHDLAVFEPYSLVKHLFAMAGLSAFTVWLACALIRERQPWLAVVVLVGVAAGPMSILAAPVDLSLLSPQSGTVWWWHLIVQGGQLVILSLWVLWTSLCIRGKRIIEGDPVQADQTHGSISSSLLFASYAAVTLTAQILTGTNNGLDSPGIVPMIGWAALGAGAAVIVIQSSWWAMSGFVFTGGVLMLGMLYEAYYREGGWPGVAGWENGTSPLILSFSASTCVLAGPLLGAMLRRRHPPAGAQVEPPVEDPVIRNAEL